LSFCSFGKNCKSGLDQKNRFAYAMEIMENKKEENQEHVVRCDERYRELINREKIGEIILETTFNLSLLERKSTLSWADDLREICRESADKVIAYIEENLFD
jgi:hypothetical protein